MFRVLADCLSHPRLNTASPRERQSCSPPPTPAGFPQGLCLQDKVQQAVQTICFDLPAFLVLSPSSQLPSSPFLFTTRSLTLTHRHQKSWCSWSASAQLLTIIGSVQERGSGNNLDLIWPIFANCLLDIAIETGSAFTPGWLNLSSFWQLEETNSKAQRLKFQLWRGMGDTCTPDKMGPAAFGCYPLTGTMHLPSMRDCMLGTQASNLVDSDSQFDRYNHHYRSERPPQVTPSWAGPSSPSYTIYWGWQLARKSRKKKFKNNPWKGRLILANHLGNTTDMRGFF